MAGHRRWLSELPELSLIVLSNEVSKVFRSSYGTIDWRTQLENLKPIKTDKNIQIKMKF